MQLILAYVLACATTLRSYNDFISEHVCKETELLFEKLTVLITAVPYRNPDRSTPQKSSDSCCDKWILQQSEAGPR